MPDAIALETFSVVGREMFPGRVSRVGSLRSVAWVAGSVDAIPSHSNEPQTTIGASHGGIIIQSGRGDFSGMFPACFLCFRLGEMRSQTKQLEGIDLQTNFDICPCR